MRSRYFNFVLTIVLVMLSACQNDSVQETMEPSLTAKPTEAAPLASATATEVIPTKTATPLPSPTVAPTSTQTLLPSSTPFLEFEDATVYEVYSTLYETVIYFIVPGVSAPYYGTVDGIAMTCEVDQDQVNLLTCRCPEDLFGSDVKHFEFYADETMTELVYAGDFATNLHLKAPTPAPSGMIYPRADYGPGDITFAPIPANCPERGINLSCEIEYRLYDDGDCLVGMSCVDSCGYYYSIDTIKNREGEWVGTGPCW